jgi:hypothetical protein
MKIRQLEKSVVVPESLIKSNVSYPAIGYYCALLVKDDIKVLPELIDELVQAGYISLTEDTIVVQNGIKEDKPTEDDSDIQQFADIINKRYKDVELRSALKAYVRKRLFPKEDSRFYNTEFKPYSLNYMLNVLDNLPDKVDVVNFCTEREYFKFFELDPLDTVKSNTYAK